MNNIAFIFVDHADVDAFLYTYTKYSQELHEQLLVALIRNGTDQCDMALKKLGNRVQYQKFKENMLAKGLQTQSRNQDLRGFRLEAVRSVSEGVLKQLRSLILSVQLQHEAANYDESRCVSSAENDSEHSNSVQVSVCPSGHSLTTIDVNLNLQLVGGNYEPHPFASKKRRRRFTTGNERQKKKSQNKDCHTLKQKSKGKSATIARKEVNRAQDNRGTYYSDYSDVENTNNHHVHDENRSRRRFRNKGKPRETSKNTRSRLFNSPKNCSNDAHLKFDREGLSNEMRRFLEANPEKYMHKKSTRTNHNRKQKQANDDVMNTNDATASGEGHRVDAVSSLVSYSENGELEPQDDCSIGKDGTDVPYLCIKLEKLFPKQSSRPILNAICHELTTSESVAEAHAKEVFNTFVRLLRGQGCRILQDCLSSSNPVFYSHLTLLASVLELINAKCNTFLDPSDESFIIFSAENCSEFVNFILLQLVDSVMSLVHPEAWSLQLENNEDVLLELGSLRDSLGNFFLLQERVSQCVTRELGCQEWRCVREGEHFFVSAVNPVDWENFLTAGVKPPKITKSRYHTFDEKLPRCEARAFWRLLDFFSRAPSLLAEDSVYSRWNLASKLAIENTLSPFDLQTELPLCAEQISAVLQDTEMLRMLLLSGSMRGLPKQDNNLFEVIKRSLECEAYNIRHNELYREKSYPVIRDENKVMKHLKSIWTIDNECKIPLHDPCPFKNIAIYLGKPEADSSWMEQPLCLPSSMLLQQSLGLLASWKSCLMRQESQNRCKRFELAVKTLIGNFLRQANTSDCSKSLMESERNGHDRFRDAFSDAAHPKCGDAEKRHGLFFIECAMYTMSVIGGLPQQPGNNLITVFEESWSMVADDVMKSRRKQFTSSIPSKQKLFQGDPYRLHIASRYLTCMALRSLGLNPFQGDFISFYVTPNPLDTIALDMVTFPMILSSLIACLDCACDSNHNMEIIASTAGCVAIIFKSYCHVLSAETSIQTVQRANTLIKSFFPKLFQSIKRGLEIVTNVSCCGSEEHVCFQALLCCIRWALHAAVKLNKMEEEEARMLTSSAVVPNGPICGPAEDNEFGDLDDSFFASIDLNHIIGTRETVNDNSFEQMLEIYKLLEDFLHLGRPSITYSLAAHGSRVNSVPGKMVIKKWSKLVCCCLTQLVAARFCPPVESISLLSLPRVLLTEDDKQDIHFKTKNCIILLRELCASEGNGFVNQLMFQKQGDIIHILLEALLRFDSFRQLPSRDIQFFRELSGETVGQEALTKLLNFAMAESNGEFQQLLKSNVATLGKVLISTEENDWLSAWKVDSDLSRRWEVRILPSVEQECFNTFAFIRSLLLMGKKTQDHPLLIAYEHLLLSVVSVIAGNLMDLYDAINNHKPSPYLDSIPLTGQSYSYAFNMLLFNIFTDMLTCLLSWAFRNQEKKDDVQTKLLQRIWDLFISPLLRQECFDLRAGLCLLSRNLQHPVPPSQLTSSTESDDLRKVMQISFIRRIQGFVLFFLKSEPETINFSFLNDIFSFVLRTDETARYLMLAVFSLDPSLSDHDEVRSPLDYMQLELLDYMALVERTCPIDQNQTIALNKLAIVSYEEIIAPWMFQPNLDRDKKTRLIQVLGELLVVDVKNVGHNCMLTNMDLKFICKLCKGVAVSLKSGFISKQHVDEDRVCAVFSCYWSLLQIPASRIEASASVIGNVLDWCYHIAMSSEVDFGSSSDLCGNYIWYLSSWLKDLGRFILNHTLEEMDTFRNTLRDSLSLNDGIIWQIPIPRQDVEVATNLFDFELKAFIKYVPSTDVKNIYSKKDSTVSVVSFETWTPSKSVQKTVLNLVTSTAITNRCQMNST